MRSSSIVGLTLLALGLAVSLATPADTQQQAKLLAPTPPMGWNSWDCYGPSVTEREVKANADMLPLGHIAIRGERGDDHHTNLTPDEQFTHMTLWSIFRSPLMFGGDLPSNDGFTLSLLTNGEVLAVDQHSTGNHELFAEGNQVAWVASVPDSRDKYLALFTLDGHAPATLRVKWTQLNLGGQCAVRDLWQHKDLGNRDSEFSVEVRPHGAQLLRIRPVE